MRMPFPNADPDNFWRSFGRECSDALDRHEEGPKLDCAQFFTKGKIDILRSVGKETEGQMHLAAVGPAHAVNARVKVDKYLFDGSRQIDRDEETLCLHFVSRTSAPGSASSPL